MAAQALVHSALGEAFRGGLRLRAARRKPVPAADTPLACPPVTGSLGPAADDETLYLKERAEEAARTLRSSLLLGAAAFLAFLILDLAMHRLSQAELIGRATACIAMVILAYRVHLITTAPSPRPVIQIARIAAVLLMAVLVGILLTDHDPASYAEAWTSLLPIYFVTYGQLILPAIETQLFGCLTTVLLSAAGYWIGTDAAILVSSALMLVVANVFGCYTRLQLEAHARRSFCGRRRAELAADEKAQFMRQAAHNLRQPLQALSCHSLVLDSNLIRNGCPEDVRRTAGKMGSAIDALNESFDRILDLANLELGRQVPHLTDVDINGLLSGLENQFLPQAARKGLRFKVFFREREPYSVRSDASILRQILCNLIDNAIKYTPEGWILVSAVRGRNGDVRICVRDTGIGIPQGEAEGVFKEFHRAHRRESDPQVDGLGIGLAYVRKAVERVHGLSLTFRSRPNLGTKFEIRVAGCDVQTCPDAQSDMLAGGLEGCNILLVEDDPEVLGALTQELQCWGCRVDQARCLDEVRNLLADSIHPPDLVMTDFYLGRGATAHDVMAAVTAECGSATVPTLILSACAIAGEDRMKWGDSVSLLRKPAGPKLLLRTILKSLGRPTMACCS